MADLTPEKIKKEWDLADKDKSGSLDYNEIVRLTKKLNLKLKQKKIKEIFKSVDVDGNKELDFEEFQVFLERLRVREEIAEVFKKLSGEKGFLSAAEFSKFLNVVQKEEIGEEKAKELIAKYEKKLNGKEATELYVSGFSAYLASVEENGIFNPEREKVFQDMTQPFAHYWIASSHNTYLLGDQLKGESSKQAYINAFEKGCKCVEMDCWDGQDINEPIIYHGHTLTSKITFREVCETVRDYGFKLSPYPVILSLEVHCSIEGQEAMAKILKEVLGNEGLLPPQPDVTGVLPPPEELKNKVLIKGKMVPFTDADEEAQEIEEDPDLAEKVNAEEKEKLESANKDKKKKPPKIAAALSELVHLKAVHFKNFEHSKENGKAWEMSSFSENKTNKILKTQPQAFLGYNTRQLSRIYPKGTRIDSSNYDPVPSWVCGSQIVALNYQTGSQPMWVNLGKFLDNGKAGYILKPKFMRENDIKFDPEKKASVTKRLYVQILSAFQLPKTEGTRKESRKTGNVIDPYVKVEMTGMSADKKSFKTKVVKNNGFNPIWKAEFKFAITNPELALLIFTVFDSDRVSADNFIAQYSLPLPCVREGFRTIPLRDSQGHFYENASLLALFKYV